MSAEKSTSSVREALRKEPLPPAQEAQAQELATAIARDLVACDDASLFGDTEFRVRDAILRVAAKAYRQRLAQKKTATRAPA